MKRITGIYAIINLLDGTMYIGQNLNVRRRMYLHFYFLRKGCHFNRHLQAAFDKDGEGNFGFGLLEECTVKKLSLREDYWLRNAPTTYNILGPGRTVPNEMRQRIAKALTGKVGANKGRAFSDQHIQRLREARQKRAIRERMSKDV